MTLILKYQLKTQNRRHSIEMQFVCLLDLIATIYASINLRLRHPYFCPTAVGKFWLTHFWLSFYNGAGRQFYNLEIFCTKSKI